MYMHVSINVLIIKSEIEVELAFIRQPQLVFATTNCYANYAIRPGFTPFLGVKLYSKVFLNLVTLKRYSGH